MLMYIMLRFHNETEGTFYMLKSTYIKSAIFHITLDTESNLMIWFMALKKNQF